MPYVFGYGSLLNEQHHAISYATLIPSPDFPVRRAFNTHVEAPIKHTAVGLEYVPYALAGHVNGLIIEVSAAGLQEIIGREVGYTQVRLGVSYFTGIPAAIDSDIIIFVPQVPAYPTEEYPLNKDYVDSCIEGFSRCSRQSALDFLRSTSGWSPDLLDYALSRLQ
jgi:hypothetical protein